MGYQHRRDERVLWCFDQTTGPHASRVYLAWHDVNSWIGHCGHGQCGEQMCLLVVGLTKRSIDICKVAISLVTLDKEIHLEIRRFISSHLVWVALLVLFEVLLKGGGPKSPLSLITNGERITKK